MIGLFDSGLGGLTVLARVRERMPSVDVLFFADQAHVPYGDRPHAELLALLRDNLARLRARRCRCDRHGVQYVVRHRGTLRLAARPAFRSSISSNRPRSRLATNVFHASAWSQPLRRSARDRTGVRFARAFPASTSWKSRPRRWCRWWNQDGSKAPAARDAVAEVCSHLPLDLDAVVFGCTHYPLLERHFRAVLGGNVALVDPAVVQAQRAAELLGARAQRRRPYALRYVRRCGVVSRERRTDAVGFERLGIGTALRQKRHRSESSPT